MELLTKSFFEKKKPSQVCTKDGFFFEKTEQILILSSIYPVKFKLLK